MLSAKEKGLLAELEPLAEENGIEIVTIEIVGARKAPTIRVYIDTPQGVSFDELAAAQSWINDRMDEIDPFPGAYTLEVSSPGIDRPLRTPEHFERFAGETVHVVCEKPIEGRGKYTGQLVGFKDEAVVVDVDGAQVSIPLSNVKKAQLKGQISFK